MKRLLAISVFLSILLSSFSQDWIYSTVQKGDNIEPRYSALDKQSNSIVLSIFQNSIYQPSLTSYGSHDIAISKYDPLGNTLWTKQIGSTNTESGGGIAVDDENNIYVLGNYSGLCKFTSTLSLTNHGDYDIFLAKYKPTGDLIWAKPLSSSVNAQVSNNMRFANGKLIICGYYKDNITIGTDISKAITLNGNTNYYHFVSLIDTTGNPQWANSYKGNDDASRFFDIAVSNDNFYICGFYKNTLYFDCDTLTNLPTNKFGAFVFKLNSTGNCQWIRKVNGTGNEVYRSLCVDNYENIYLVGAFWGTNTIRIDSTSTLYSNQFINSTSYNLIIAKYNSDGILQWKAAKGNGSLNYPYSLSFRNNVLYGSGYYSGQLIFGNDTLVSSSTNNQDPFLFVYSHSGKEFGGISMKGSGNYYDAIYNLNTDIDSKVYAFGYYRSQNFQIGSQLFTSTNTNLSDQFFAVYKHPLIALVKDQKDPGCYGWNDGVLEVEPYFGKPPYTYVWSHNALLNQSRLTDLAAGTYIITITDALGEQTTVSKTLSQPGPVGFSAIITSVQCNGDSTGAADVTVLNASGTPTFDWSTGATTEDETNLKAGTYTLTVTDSIGCTAFGVITVDEPDPMGLVVTKDAANLCYGDSIASLTANPSGGMGLFSYQWNDALYQTDQTATGLGQGSYAVLVTDANGCTLSDTTVITQPDSISLDIVTTDPTCAGLSNGSAIPTVSGGTPQYDYAWSNGVFERFNTDIPAGDYTLTITDGNNCLKTASVTLGEPAALVLDAITPQDASCFGYEDGSLEISASGGTGTLQYSIDGTDKFMSPLFDSLAAGTYTIRVTDSLDCAAETTAEITQPEGMALTVSQFETIACHGAATASATVSVTGATGAVSYLWDDPEAQTADTALNLGAGDYSVQATDASGCKVTGGITVSEPEILTIDTTEVVQIDETHPAGSVTLEASGGTGPFTFVITPDSTSAATGVFTELAAGDYAFFATDVNGCTSEDFAVTITEGEVPVSGLQFYDAFSPNGDGKNDVWHIRNIEQYPDCVVKIFNSWGTPVFSSKGYGTPWDGKSGGKELPSGTYYYLVDPGDGSPSRTGPVSLVK
jgi:gliding motility-associated-like protein